MNKRFKLSDILTGKSGSMIGRGKDHDGRKIGGDRRDRTKKGDDHPCGGQHLGVCGAVFAGV